MEEKDKVRDDRKKKSGFLKENRSVKSNIQERSTRLKIDQEPEMEEKARQSISIFELLGGVEGVRALANCFYDTMDSLPEARRIREMHPKDLEPTCENFTLFLCGWLGGPALYKEKYGSLDLTGLHALLKINEADRDMWLLCMKQALEKQNIEEDLQNSLLRRFRVPAEKICNWCQQQFMNSPLLPSHLK